MTEQTTTPAAPQTVENPAPPVPPMFLPTFEANRNAIIAIVEQANKLAAQVRAQSNVETELQDLIDTSDDPQIVAYREFAERQERKLAEALETIRNYAKENHLKTDESYVDPEKALVSWKESKTQVDVLRKMLGGLAPEETVSQFLADVPALADMGRHKGSKGEGTTRRPRIARARFRIVGTDEWLDGGKDGKYTMTSLCNAVRKHGKVDNGDVQVEADKAAGTTEWVSLEGRPFTFHYSAADRKDDSKSTLVEIEVTPKATETNDESASE